MKTTTKKENNQEEDFCEKQFWTLQNVDELFMEYIQHSVGKSCSNGHSICDQEFLM